ncbi:Cna B-type domain-containing protein [Vagococcus sp. DIV0080]|uniref:Cna B-type domain-containing protein n=1 Tax=Candidatus Vagococcus giribetii TaxID=2230876 RepID=A0ABS3HQT2_9ENTE|nr:Cna B-type domain-containing protein [Vagococcus sp. DIV0080]MBO0476108.1 Cna B-type domain-containing protein [Vagococcus sp. DIV0080]
MKDKKKFGIVLILVVIINLFTSVIASANTSLMEERTLFEYTQDGNRGGLYPTNGTHIYQGVTEKDTVKNFDFTNTRYPYYPYTKSVASSMEVFDSGYHAYRDKTGQMDVYAKKIVKPTDDPTKFEVTLDVLSGFRETKSPIDIAFVIDKSGSMNEWINSTDTRWTALKKSISYFVDNFPQTIYDTRYALSSFASYSQWGGNYPYFDLGQHQDGSFFTGNTQYVKNNQLLSVNPAGGTPTFVGVEAGVVLLTQPSLGVRADANKYLIYITDGGPTFDGVYEPAFNKRVYTGIENHTQNGIRFSLPQSYYYGNGTQPPSSVTGLENFIGRKYNSVPSAYKYSIGIGSDLVGFPNNRVLQALGPDGRYTVVNNVEADLKEALQSIQDHIMNSLSSITEATIVDPMSDFVELDQDSVKTYQLTLDKNTIHSLSTTDQNAEKYAKEALVDIYDNEINVKNLTLKGDFDKAQGYRVTYQVTLKEPYQEGRFYPTNNRTYLLDKDPNYAIDFAVPAVKHRKTTEVKVDKIWKGDNENHPAIKIALLANNQEVSTVTLNKGELSHVFKELPFYDDDGKKIEYTIKEYPVEGYESTLKRDTDGSFILTNYPKGKFEANKLSDKDKLKPGEEFTYTIKVDNIVTDSTIKQLRVVDDIPNELETIGDVFLNGVNLGGIVNNKLDVTIPTLKGNESALITFKVRVKVKAPEGKILNTAIVTDPEKPDEPEKPTTEVEVIRKTPIKLVKTDIDGKTLLPDAEFALYSIKNGKEELIETKISNQSGVIMFEELASGDYRLVETKAPENYQKLSIEVLFTIDKYGDVTVTDANSEYVTYDVVNNQFEFLVKNEPIPPGGILPETGGRGTFTIQPVAVLLLSVSLILSAYALYRRRKGW